MIDATQVYENLADIQGKIDRRLTQQEIGDLIKALVIAQNYEIVGPIGVEPITNDSGEGNEFTISVREVTDVETMKISLVWGPPAEKPVKKPVRSRKAANGTS